MGDPLPRNTVALPVKSNNTPVKSDRARSNNPVKSDGAHSNAGGGAASQNIQSINNRDALMGGGDEDGNDGDDEGQGQGQGTAQGRAQGRRVVQERVQGRDEGLDGSDDRTDASHSPLLTPAVSARHGQSNPTAPSQTSQSNPTAPSQNSQSNVTEHSQTRAGGSYGRPKMSTIFSVGSIGTGSVLDSGKDRLDYDLDSTDAQSKSPSPVKSDRAQSKPPVKSDLAQSNSPVNSDKDSIDAFMSMSQRLSQDDKSVAAMSMATSVVVDAALSAAATSLLLTVDVAHSQSNIPVKPDRSQSNSPVNNRSLDVSGKSNSAQGIGIKKSQSNTSHGGVGRLRVLLADDNVGVQTMVSRIYYCHVISSLPSSLSSLSPFPPSLPFFFLR